MHPANKDYKSKLARICNSQASTLSDRLQNAIWQCVDASWISFARWTQSEVFSSARPHLTQLPGRMLLPRSWTVEKQSLPCQESSCDYCNANLPVITLRACQALMENWGSHHSHQCDHTADSSLIPLQDHIWAPSSRNMLTEIFIHQLFFLLSSLQTKHAQFFFFLRSYCENKSCRSDHFLKEKSVWCA